MNKIRGIPLQQSENGQVLVIIVLAIVGLFGFAALAIDMGQIFMARRASQGAADAAAMAAALDAVAGSMDRDTAITKAFEQARLNGYNNDQTTNWVVVNNPPVDGPYCGICGNPLATEYFQVKITVQLNPIFAQLIYNGAKQTTIEATAHAKGISTVTSGDALVSLSGDDTSLEFDGKTGVNISGGNIRSMGGMVKNGASGGIIVNPGSVYYSTTFKGHTSPFSPAKPSKNTAGTIRSFTPPYCPTSAETKDGTWTKVGSNWQKSIKGVNYYYYPSSLNIENLPAGIHCIEGGIGKGNYTGKNVLLVLLSGGIKQTGGDSLNLRAPQNIEDANGNFFGGLLLYAPASNRSELQIGGNSDAYVQGTIFAPGASCKIGGTSSGVAYRTSIVCYDIKIHGNPVLKIIYKEEGLFRLSASVTIVE